MKRIAAITLIVVAGATGCSSGGTQTPAPPVTTAEVPSSPVTAEAPAPPATQNPLDNATPGQKNALRKAESYIESQAFSRQGLIEQLEFNKFPTEDATWAVDQLTVDWKEQAAKKAKSYLENQAFSRQGLIDQLVFNGFNLEQAEYGVTQAGL